jgi:cytochrome c oxidase cbb3-type subunit I/II
MDATEIKMKALEQGVKIATELKKSNIVVRPDSEMVAVIAYLQKLGQFEQPAVEEALSKKGQGVPFPLTPIIPDNGRRANGAE